MKYDYKDSASTQRIEFLISTTKIPHMVSTLSLEVQAHFPLGKLALSDDANNFQDAYMEIYSMNIFHSNSYTAMLRVTFKNKVNVSFSNKIKDFFESYLHISLESKKEFKNKNMYTVCYYAHMSKNELMNITIDFYNRTKQFSYSQIFTLDYLESLYNKYGSEGNFGYLHYYSLDRTGQLGGSIDFSYSTFDNYSDGSHTVRRVSEVRADRRGFGRSAVGTKLDTRLLSDPVRGEQPEGLRECPPSPVILGSSL